jgi:ribosomal protein S18 acetylase RimI-like enzyme
MTTPSTVRPAVRIHSGERPSLTAELERRIYEFNCAATEIADGEGLHAELRDEHGGLVAGLSGHTWGGTCEIVFLWVREANRGRGLGTALLAAAEAEALRRGCAQVVLMTHTFQAPRLYERLGYRRVAEIADYPRGHAKLAYAKRLAPSSA